MKPVKVGCNQDRPVQGGIYAEPGSMSGFKVLAVGHRHGKSIFAVQHGLDISIFRIGWWKTIFPLAKLLRVVDSGEPLKGEGSRIDGRMYYLFNVAGNIELRPCPHEDDDLKCRPTIH